MFRDQANGNRVVIHLVGQGESIADALLSADDVLYPASAEAASHLRVARFDIRTYRQHIRKVRSLPCLSLLRPLGNFAASSIRSSTPMNGPLGSRRW